MAQEPLAPAALQSHLRTAVFGHRVFYYPTIGSTNDRALDLAVAGEPEGAVVLAEEQTGGRGRRERTWHSPARLGIYVSLILRPLVPATRAPLFTFTAAVAAASALRETCSLQAAIKWPNDVVVERRKIAGILGETRGSDCQCDDHEYDKNHTRPFHRCPLHADKDPLRVRRCRADLERSKTQCSSKPARVTADAERSPPGRGQGPPDLYGCLPVESTDADRGLSAATFIGCLT